MDWIQLPCNARLGSEGLEGGLSIMTGGGTPAEASAKVRPFSYREKGAILSLNVYISNRQLKSWRRPFWVEIFASQEAEKGVRNFSPALVGSQCHPQPSSEQ